jgi:hypothetical protein
MPSASDFLALRLPRFTDLQGDERVNRSAGDERPATDPNRVQLASTAHAPDRGALDAEKTGSLKLRDQDRLRRLRAHESQGDIRRAAAQTGGRING